MDEEKKKCARCGVPHPLYFFRKKGQCHGYVTYRPICKECESKERIAKRDTNPFRPKARDAIARHAKQEGMSSKYWSHKYGTTLDYIEMLFRDAWLLHENGSNCHSCFKLFKHSLDDFTLDKIFPNQPPTRSNLRVICRTCNTAKGIKDPIQYDLESLEYDRAKEAVKKGVQFDFDLSHVSVTKKSARISENQLILFQLDSLGPDLS